MAEKRKLLNEMEKCFKKIDEGVEIFEETMGKMNEANSDNQRDKLQDDLKKEIKKLQRLREQIKGWQNSSDIKDKEKLNQYRRLIEQRMETFKDVERENKTKPHSKQGLSAEEKMDPREKEKFETLEWLNTQIRKIQEEIDRTESKIESFSTPETGKKKGKGKDKNADKEKVEELKKHLDRVQFHLQNLEVCMRMITNEKLDIKDVLNKLKEPLDMYIEALDPDCDEDPANLEPDDIYEELGLGDYLSQLGATAFHSLDDDKGPHKSPSGSPTHDEQSKARHISGEFQKTTRSKSITSNSTAPPTPATPTSATTHNKMTRQTSGDNSSSISSPPPQTPPPAIRTKVALQNSVPHAGATSNPIVTKPIVPAAVPAPHVQPSYASAAAQSQQRVTHPQAAPGVTPLTMPGVAQIVSTQPAVGTPVESLISNQSASLTSPLVNSPVPANAKSLSYATVAAGSNMTPPPTSSDSTTKQQQLEGKVEEKSILEQEMNPKGLNAVLMSSEIMRGYIGIDESNEPKTPQNTTIQPWLGGLPLGEITPTEDMQNSLRMFESVASKAPTVDDSGKLRPVMPKTPCQTAPYYPQKVQSIFETLDYYTRLQPETLFFTFYFMEGTKAQLLAAKALKKLAWRYHTKYLTWFQRHEEPKQITDDYEMGTYIFFDFEKWARRKRENFMFEYKYLEDKDVD